MPTTPNDPLAASRPRVMRQAAQNPGAYNASATGQQIRDMATSGGFTPGEDGRYTPANDTMWRDIWAHSRTNGFSGDQIDNAFGWRSGTMNDWVASQGLGALATAPAAPAQAPAAPARTYQPPQAPTIPTYSESTQQQNPMLGNWFQSYMQSNPTMTAPAQAQQTQWNVTPDQLVESRIGGIIDSNSPLMQAARARGLREANATGMRNATAGMRTAENAVMDRAYEIANADAQMLGAAGRFNAGEANDISTTNATEANRWGISDLDRRVSAATEQQRIAEQGREADQSASTQIRIAGMNYDLADRRLSQEDRQFLQSNALAHRQLDTQISQFAQRLGLDRDQLELNRDRMSQDDRQFYDQLAMRGRELDQDDRHFNTDWSNRFTLQNLEQQGRIDLAHLDADNRVALTNLDGQWRSRIANNQLIGNAWGTMVSEINRIQNNPDLEPDARTTLIDNIITGFDQYARFESALSDGAVNVDELLAFGTNFRRNNPPSGTSTNSAANRPQDNGVVPGGGGDGGGDGGAGSGE